MNLPGLTKALWPALLLLGLFLPPAQAQEFGEEETPDVYREKAAEEWQGVREKGFLDRFSFSIEGILALPVLGDAGSGNDAPSWADAFSIGGGGRLKIGITLCPALELQIDAGEVIFQPREFTSLGTDNLLTEFKTAHILAGLGLFIHFSEGRAKPFAFSETSPFPGLALTLSVRGGLQYSDHLFWTEPKPRWSYWKPTLTAMGAASLGLVYRLNAGVAILLCFEALCLSPPDPTDHAGTRASADSLITAGASLSLSYHL
jgi:hypothetical protein